MVSTAKQDNYVVHCGVCPGTSAWETGNGSGGNEWQFPNLWLAKGEGEWQSRPPSRPAKQE